MSLSRICYQRAKGVGHCLRHYPSGMLLPCHGGRGEIQPRGPLNTEGCSVQEWISPAVPHGMGVWRAANPRVAAKVSSFPAESLGGQRNFCCPGSSMTWGAVQSAATLVATQMLFSYCTWHAVMEGGGSCHHGTPLAGWSLSLLHLCLLIVPVLGMRLKFGNCICAREGGFRFSELLDIAAPVHFVPRHGFILHFCGFSGKALFSWVSWVGGEDRKGQEKAVDWS